MLAETLTLTLTLTLILSGAQGAPCDGKHYEIVCGDRSHLEGCVTDTAGG